MVRKLENKMALRIQRDGQDNNYVVCSGDGSTFRCWGIAVGIKNAEKLLRASKNDASITTQLQAVMYS